MENIDIIQQIKDTLDKIRPFIVRDGGDIEFSRFDEKSGIVYIKFLGACVGCVMIDDTLSLGISTILQEEVPGVTKVEIDPDSIPPAINDFNFEDLN